MDTLQRAEREGWGDARLARALEVKEEDVEYLFTEADTWEELKQAVRDAVQCHFDKVAQPDLIRL